MNPADQLREARERTLAATGEICAAFRTTLEPVRELSGTIDEETHLEFAMLLNDMQMSNSELSTAIRNCIESYTRLARFADNRNGE